MSSVAKQYRTEVARVLDNAGARVLRRGTDGRNHDTVTFELHGAERTFHFACTGRSSGRSIKNTLQRLKWMIRDIPAPITAPPIKEAMAKEKARPARPAVVTPSYAKPRPRITKFNPAPRSVAPAPAPVEPTPPPAVSKRAAPTRIAKADEKRLSRLVQQHYFTMGMSARETAAALGITVHHVQRLKDL